MVLPTSVHVVNLRLVFILILYDAWSQMTSFAQAETCVFLASGLFFDFAAWESPGEFAEFAEVAGSRWSICKEGELLSRVDS
jgi:hypothetical protein